MTRTFIAAAAFATFAISGAAQAATTTVQTRDLDLATAAGQAKLDARPIVPRATCAAKP